MYCTQSSLKSHDQLGGVRMRPRPLTTCRHDVLSVSVSVVQTLPLISQSRRLVRQGPVTELMDFSLKDTERNVYLHLFNDYLLLSQQKE